MNETELRVLVALAEEGTFTDAAIRLRMSQPTVSRALARFEARLGVTLVERTTRSLRLTGAGDACYRAAVSALLAMDEVRAAAHGRSRPLRLGYAWAVFGRHTTAVLHTWRTERPDVPLEIHRIDARDAGLTHGLVDVAIRRGDLVSTTGPGEEQELIFVEGRLAAVPAGSPLAGHETLTLADLTGQVIAYTPGVGTTSPELWPPEARPARFVDVANTDEWLLTIASGIAVGVTPESTPTQHAHPGVTYVPMPGAPPIGVRLAWSQMRRHPAIDDFLAVVRRCVGPLEAPGQQGDQQADPGQAGGDQVR